MTKNHQMKNLRLHNVCIYINSYQNEFIIECASESLANIPKSHSPVVFFVRCRRTYVLNKIFKIFEDRSYISAIIARKQTPFPNFHV